MLLHKFDSITGMYTESVESEEMIENSTYKTLPEITEHYTVAFIENEWVSVLEPKFEIVGNKIEPKDKSIDITLNIENIEKSE